MKIPPDSHEIAPPPIPDEKREELFLHLFSRLNKFAGVLGGFRWNNDQIFNVGIERTCKLPTSKKGVFDREAYCIETVSFVAEKHESGDPDCPFFNVFYLSQTVSSPMDIEETDPAHHEKLFDHFLQFFPNIMNDVIQSLAGPVESSVLTEDEELDLDAIDPDVRFDIVNQAVDGADIVFRLAETVNYTIVENGQIIEFATDRTYEIGSTIYPLVKFDSVHSSILPVHAPFNDSLPLECVDDPEEAIQYPASEKVADDPGELALLEEAFYDVVGEAFNEEDHGAIPYIRHVKKIKQILKKLRTSAE